MSFPASVQAWRDWWLRRTSSARMQIMRAFSWSWTQSWPWSSEERRSRVADSTWLVHLSVLFSFKRSLRRCTCAMSVPMSLRSRRLSPSWQFACFNPRPFVGKSPACSAESPHEITGLFQIYLPPGDRTGADCPLYGRLRVVSELWFAAGGRKSRGGQRLSWRRRHWRHLCHSLRRHRSFRRSSRRVHQHLDRFAGGQRT